jgi:hypothetical protein
MTILLLLTACPFVWSQSNTTTALSNNGPTVALPTKSDAMLANALVGNSATCVEPEPVFGIEDYNGPLKHLVIHIAGKPDIKTVHAPHSKPGTVLCSLRTGEKFKLFVQDTFEPVTFAIVGANAGFAQAENDDPGFGQGTEGFGRRYGAAFADQVSGEFFGTFLYPTLFHEDPRYYRMGHGNVGKRFGHAFGHAFITHRDSGAQTFNFSEWVGTASGTALGNLYHSGNRRGFEPAARGVTYSVLTDAGWDMLREFWPEICKKGHLPFKIRDQH